MLVTKAMHILKNVTPTSRRKVALMLFLLVDILLMMFLRSDPTAEIIFQVRPKRHFLDFPSRSVNGNDSFMTLGDVFTSLESPVIMTTVNHGFVDLLHNLLFSIQRISLKKDIVIICEDRSSYLELSQGVKGLNITYHAVLTLLDESVENATNYGSKTYLSLVQKRVIYMKHFVRSKLDVLYIDADIVLLGDPFPHFKEDYDLVIQSEDEWGSNLCTGFMFFRVKERLHIFLDAWSRELHSDKRGNQGTFNRVRRKYRRLVNIQVLPVKEFASGKMFRKSSTPWRERVPRPVEVHANWVVGHAKKVDMLKEADLWFVPPRDPN